MKPNSPALKRIKIFYASHAQTSCGCGMHIDDLQEGYKNYGERSVAGMYK